MYLHIISQPLPISFQTRSLWKRHTKWARALDWTSISWWCPSDYTIHVHVDNIIIRKYINYLYDYTMRYKIVGVTDRHEHVPRVILILCCSSNLLPFLSLRFSLFPLLCILSFSILLKILHFPKFKGTFYLFEDPRHALLQHKRVSKPAYVRRPSYPSC